MTKKSKLRLAVTSLFFFSFFGLPELSSKLWGREIELESESLVLLAILLTGPFWCGWFCPFGHAQELSSWISKKLFKGKTLTIPPDFDRPLRTLKYIFLIAFLIVFATGSHGYFGDHYDMYQSTLFSKIYLAIKKPWAIFIIPLFIPRFFCKYICYQKAAYQLINRIAPVLKIKRQESACTHCKKCVRLCPMDVTIDESDTITGGECIGCLSCVDTTGCPPKFNALKLTWFGRPVSPLWFCIIASILYITATLLLVL